MGSACCVARGDTLANRTSGENLHRNAIYSPSWSFRWDNRRRVAGEVENVSHEPSHGISTNSSLEIKGDLVLDRGSFSGRGSPLGNFGTPASQNSPVHDGLGASAITSSDVTLSGNDNAKVQSSTESSSEIVDSSAPKLSLSVASSSPFLTPTADPISSQTLSLPATSSQLRKAHQSPGHHLLRQVSDSQILGLKSPNDCSLVSEGIPSSVLSNCSNDTMVGSQGGSSDGWSMQTFSELVASSQKERGSFDSDFLGSARDKLTESSGSLSYSPSIDLQTCGVCAKLLTERSSWISSCELSVVGVLVCGHVYHAECLEAMTQEADRYDPTCPICLVGEKRLSKMARKVLKAEAELKSRSNKISRNRIVDGHHEAGLDVLDRRKTSRQEENFPEVGPSSSARRSFAKPFLSRHFSLGSKWSRSLSENNSARKGFWARYRKD